MSVSYDAGNEITNVTWITALLSERDVAGQIPINFVINPAVALSSACFGNGLYATKAAGDCISNLLAVGYRRLYVDLYWSTSRRKWTFCPAEIPNADSVVMSSAATADLTKSIVTTASSTYSTATGISGLATASSTGHENSQGETILQLGSHRCSRDLDLTTLSDILRGFFTNTKSQLLISTNYLILNLHVASNGLESADSTRPLAPENFPASDSERLGSALDQALASYLYTPSELASDRSNLGNSWFQVDEKHKPIVEYFTLHTDSAGIQSTPDGWPSSNYVQLAKTDRLFVGYGSIDPQLAAYDYKLDGDIIFPPGYLTSTTDITTTSNGSVSSGCLFKPGATEISQANSSWAFSASLPVPDMSSGNETLASVTRVASNIGGCGLSVVLNSTLFGETADANAANYRNVSLSTSWAWVDGEPNGAATGGGTNDVPSFDRCAVLDVSSQGHWRTANCSQHRRAACRIGTGPFSWSLSNATAEYNDAANNCPPQSSPAVPRTGLENTYLYRYLLNQPKDIIDPTSLDPARREVFLDFNSIDITSCWVSGGPTAKCPYASDPQQLEHRTVLVAAIAGIIIVIITALTLFVKCNANRRNTRRRKRVIEGWEYEGVPS
ncbi:Uncharacterized protein PECH_004956 [Penicillium ucsense]|uniref:Maintenance of telomere capping protein 6 n=1 Tax=Penicillium ucsense TaxID=2839758 RepID=A0A8J8W1G1_9EURO|nr:Uncharacterized protein PECM_008279 [Penicillium ucsense]KAF7736746.1 Uncharacterized protein PECH_004956 [Penicillium ucsense]